ncbi:hypothetical protein JL720_11963 [Aureococcus anophagefferens]|nr:hypothetical protein JL720_11963 [Aureococcus anophagefferens]
MFGVWAGLCLAVGAAARDAPFAVQVAGAKAWRLCVPHGPDPAASAADRAELAEARLRTRGCTSFEGEELAVGGAFASCEAATVAAGETLYVPKGVAHAARTPAGGAVSAHVAVAAERDGGRWVDVFLEALDAAPATGASDAARAALVDDLQWREPRVARAVPAWGATFHEGAAAPSPGARDTYGDLVARLSAEAVFAGADALEIGAETPRGVAGVFQGTVVQNGPGYYTTNPLYPGQIQMGGITHYREFSRPPGLNRPHARRAQGPADLTDLFIVFSAFDFPMGDTGADTWATKAASAVVVEAKAMSTSIVSFADAAPRPPIRPRGVMTPAEFQSMDAGRTAPLTLFYTSLAKQDADGVPVDGALLVHGKSTHDIDEDYTVVKLAGIAVADAPLAVASYAVSVRALPAAILRAPGRHRREATRQARRRGAASSVKIGLVDMVLVFKKQSFEIFPLGGRLMYAAEDFAFYDATYSPATANSKMRPKIITYVISNQLRGTCYERHVGVRRTPVNLRGGKRMTLYVVVGDFDSSDMARIRGKLRPVSYLTVKLLFYHVPEQVGKVQTRVEERFKQSDGREARRLKQLFVSFPPGLIGHASSSETIRFHYQVKCDELSWSHEIEDVIDDPDGPAGPPFRVPPVLDGQAVMDLLGMSEQGRLAAIFGRDNLAACMDARVEVPNAVHRMDNETASMLSRASNAGADNRAELRSTEDLLREFGLDEPDYDRASSAGGDRESSVAAVTDSGSQPFSVPPVPPPGFAAGFGGPLALPPSAELTEANLRAARAEEKIEALTSEVAELRRLVGSLVDSKGGGSPRGAPEAPGSQQPPPPGGDGSAMEVSQQHLSTPKAQGEPRPRSLGPLSASGVLASQRFAMAGCGTAAEPQLAALPHSPPLRVDSRDGEGETEKRRRQNRSSEDGSGGLHPD